MRIKALQEDKKKASKGTPCFYCSRFMTSNKTQLYKEDPGLLATFDHKLSQSKKGSNEPDNIIICCYRCNNLKGEIPYDVFYPFSRVILKQYPDMSTMFLRRILNHYILFLAETAIRSGHNKRIALSAALLHAGDIAKEG